jgi:hypothetical protein
MLMVMKVVGESNDENRDDIAGPGVIIVMPAFKYCQCDAGDHNDAFRCQQQPMITTNYNCI